jgi:hypothetical protein
VASSIVCSILKIDQRLQPLFRIHWPRGSEDGNTKLVSFPDDSGSDSATSGRAGAFQANLAELTHQHMPDDHNYIWMTLADAAAALNLE